MAASIAQRIHARDRTNGTWRNWAGNVTAVPARWHRRASMDDICEAVSAAARDGLTVRAVGSGHSFTPVAATTGAVVDLSRWTGITAADTRTGLVTVRSGTLLRNLNADLHRLGLALANLGDIDVQTIAGAISTGTHGTGAALGGIATQVEELELIVADGSAVRCSASQRPGLFAAARVGLGALGIITEVTLRCVPSFVLAAEEGPEPLDEVIARFGELAAANDHFEFYWFPYGRNALVKRNNRAPAGAVAAPLSPPRRFYEYEVMENAGFGLLCRAGRAAPRLIPRLNRLSAEALSRRAYSDRSYRVFTTPRRVRFIESEYAVPPAPLRTSWPSSAARCPSCLSRSCSRSRCGSPRPMTSGCRPPTAVTPRTSRSTSTPACRTRRTSRCSSRSRPGWAACRTGARCTTWPPAACGSCTRASATSSACATRWTRAGCSPAPTWTGFSGHAGAPERSLEDSEAGVWPAQFAVGGAGYAGVHRPTTRRWPLVRLTFLRPLYQEAGWFASVYLETSRASPDAGRKAVPVRWRDLREELSREGADPATLDALGEVVTDPAMSAPGAAAFGRSGSVPFAAKLATSPLREIARWAPLPQVMPLLVQSPPRPPHLLVSANRAGGDILAVRTIDDVLKESVEGTGWPVHKTRVGGWAQLEHQRSTEEAWEVNAKELAAAVVSAASGTKPELIVVAGDVRARGMLIDKLPSDLKAKVVVVERELDVDSPALAEAADEALRAAADQDCRTRLETFRNQLGTGRATEGLTETVAALRDGQVAELFLGGDYRPVISDCPP